MKKILMGAAAFFEVMLIFAAKPVYNFNSKVTVKDKKSVAINKEISAVDFVKQMDCGWNLGNTLDATGAADVSSETSWDQPKTTKEMIEGIAAAGFKTIRLPVSWANHLIDNKYTVDPAWIKRVKEIVDWAIDAGLYVIINDHHDQYTKEGLMPHASGYYPNSLNWNESMLFLKNLWAQISISFNSGYDERLIFEIVNEPRLCGHEHEWWYNPNCTACKNGASTLNRLNQICLDTIRSSGKNNAHRFVMITGLAASVNSYHADDSFVLPADTATDRLIVSIHMYSPYTFAMENPGTTVFESKLAWELSQDFDFLAEKFVSKGVPVVIGEFGATNKNNPEERVKWFKFFMENARKYGMCSVLWDNGDWNVRNTFAEKFGFYNRLECSWYFPEIVKAIVEK